MQMSQQTDTCTYTVHPVKQIRIERQYAPEKNVTEKQGLETRKWQLLLLPERKGLEIHPYNLWA